MQTELSITPGLFPQTLGYTSIYHHAELSREAEDIHIPNRAFPLLHLQEYNSITVTKVMSFNISCEGDKK